MPVGARSGRPGVVALRTAAEFERLLRIRPRMISAHFAVHHLAIGTGSNASAPASGVVRELSTDRDPKPGRIVDDSAPTTPALPRWGYAAVVPKRHARRAVTRSLLKREMRAAFTRRVDALEPGAWLVRLRSGYDRAQYPSAASRALQLAVRAELDALFAGRARSASAP